MHPISICQRIDNLLSTAPSFMSHQKTFESLILQVANGYSVSGNPLNDSLRLATRTDLQDIIELNSNVFKRPITNLSTDLRAAINDEDVDMQDCTEAVKLWLTYKMQNAIIKQSVSKLLISEGQNGSTLNSPIMKTYSGAGYSPS